MKIFSLFIFIIIIGLFLFFWKPILSIVAKPCGAYVTSAFQKASCQCSGFSFGLDKKQKMGDIQSFNHVNYCLGDCHSCYCEAIVGKGFEMEKVDCDSEFAKVAKKFIK